MTNSHPPDRPRIFDCRHCPAPPTTSSHAREHGDTKHLTPVSPGTMGQPTSGDGASPTGSRGAAAIGTIHPLPRLLCLREVSDILCVSISHLRREIRLRRLAVHRLGHALRISEPDLAEYLDRRRRATR